MKKLRIEELAVESFATVDEVRYPGTVIGLEDCEMTRCDCETNGACSTYCTQPEDYTCLASCDCDTEAGERTCYATCYLGLTCPGGGGGGGSFGASYCFGCGGEDDSNGNTWCNHTS